jgi:hypothetical protein
MPLALIKPDGSFLTISQRKYEQWVADYPNLDIKYEITKANEWLSRNSSRGWKTLNGFQKWLDRAQENAPKGKQKLSETVPFQESDNYALRYEREHPPEAPQRASEATALRELERALEQCRIPYQTKEKKAAVKPLFCKHEFKPSFYGGGDWCTKCGTFAAQWFCLDIDRPKECFCRRVISE